MYTGLMYNDIFSQSLHIWHSGWKFAESNSTSVTGVNTGHVYPFGLDPGWHGADNALVFTNSYKMKMSIVLGVTHVRMGNRPLSFLGQFQFTGLLLTMHLLYR